MYDTFFRNFDFYSSKVVFKTCYLQDIVVCTTLSCFNTYLSDGYYLREFVFLNPKPLNLGISSLIVNQRFSSLFARLDFDRPFIPSVFALVWSSPFSSVLCERQTFLCNGLLLNFCSIEQIICGGDPLIPNPLHVRLSTCFILQVLY